MPDGVYRLLGCNLDRLGFLARQFTAKEKVIVKKTLSDMRTFFEKQPDAAKDFLATGESKPSDKVPASQLAAMTMVANQLMNLDAVLNK